MNLSSSSQTKSSVGPVSCSQCGQPLVRQLWNYGKNRPMEKFFCDKTCKGNWQRAQRESLGFTKEWLYEQYVVKQRNTSDIAKEIGRDAKRVWEWIRDYGIPTRSRGYGDLSLLFPKGHSLNTGTKLSPEHREKIRAARMRDGRVPYKKNGIHWLHATGRKPAAWKGGISPERQAFYATEAWKECVKAVWKREDARCQRCHLDHRTILRGVIRFHLHHIDSFQIVERRADPSNIALLCDSCHRWVHSKKNAERQLLGKGH